MSEMRIVYKILIGKL